MRLRARVPDDRPARRGRGQPRPPLVASGAVRPRAAVLAAVWLAVGVAPAVAQPPAQPAMSPQCITLEDFAKATVGEFPTEWKPRKDAGKDVYRVLEEQGLRFLRAASKRLGIQAAKQVEWDLDAYPMLAWSWRPRQFPTGADERVASTNDSALAVYLLVPYSRIAGPKAVKYIWSEKAPVGTHLTSNYGLTQVLVLRSDEGTTAVPIIMLTAKSEEVDRVVGLEVGADDYVVKPFSPKELVARVRALLRRTRPAPEARVLSAGPLALDVARHVVTLHGQPLPLTPKEFDLLHALLESAGRVLSREHLLNRVWGYARADEIESRTVDVHIRRLRAKLGDVGNRIATVKSVGYRFETE